MLFVLQLSNPSRICASWSLHLRNQETCPCHLLHIAAKTGSSTLRCKVDDRLIDIFFYLENSSKRLKSLHKFQLETGCAIKKILKHGPTRWLSLVQCVNRLLEQWDALQQFFSAEKEKLGDKPVPERLGRIIKFFDNHLSKLYAMLLKYSLPMFVDANLLLQKEEPMLHKLQPRLHEIATDLLTAFIKPSAITRCADIYSIEHSRRSRQEDREELGIGEAARDYINALKGNGLTDSDITYFFTDVRAFYSASLGYMFSKLPMQQVELEKATVMDVSKRATAKFEDVRFWLNRFSCLKKSTDVDELNKEFSKYQVDQLEGLNMEERVDVLWAQISTLKDSSGKLKFAVLGNFMKGLLAIPHSNADVERVLTCEKKQDRG